MPIFTKIPYLGTVKSRLSHLHAEKQAATIYAAMLRIRFGSRLVILPTIAIEIYLANGSRQELQNNMLRFKILFAPRRKKQPDQQFIKSSTISSPKGEDIGTHAIRHYMRITAQTSGNTDRLRLSWSYCAISKTSIYSFRQTPYHTYSPTLG